MSRRPAHALIAAAVCLAGLTVTGIVALLTPTGQLHDNATLNGFLSLNRPSIAPVASFFTHLGDPRVYVMFGVAFVVVALLRRRPRVALVVVLTMAFAPASAELLKPLLATPKIGSLLNAAGEISGASWPSGHATAAMTAGLCAVLVAPRVLRPVAALLGTLLAVGVGYSVLVLDWHLPSDVFGGYLVAGTWVSLGVAVLWWAELRWPAHSGRRALARAADRSIVPAMVLVAAIAGLVVVVAMRRSLIASYAAGHASFVAGALAIAALAATLAAGLTLALRSGDR
jgi:membrane-associated phospholipid phosphatase